MPNNEHTLPSILHAGTEGLGAQDGTLGNEDRNLWLITPSWCLRPPPHPLIFVFVLFIYLCIYIVCLLFQFELIPLLLTPLYFILFHNWGHTHMLWYFAKTPSLSGLYRVLTYPSRHPGMSMCLDAPLTADVTFHLACGHFSSFSSCWAALQDTNKGYCAWPRE